MKKLVSIAILGVFLVAGNIGCSDSKPTPAKVPADAKPDDAKPADGQPGKIPARGLPK